MSKFLVYTLEITERLKYAFDLILKDQLGLDMDYTSNDVYFNEYKGYKINYSHTQFDGCFHVSPVSLLFELDINGNVPDVKVRDGIKVLYSSKHPCNMGFDIFAASFFMVTRYEEYLDFIPDRFGRFKAEDSLAYKSGFIRTPVVNTWAILLKEKLDGFFANLTFKTRDYEYICTLDIDNAFAYKHKGSIRTIRGIIRDGLEGRFDKIGDRILVLLNLMKDPFDTYDLQEEIIKNNKIKSIHFFLMGDYGPFDKNLSHKSNALQRVIKKCAQFSRLGIHPSYASNLKQSFSIEKSRLSEILDDAPISISRQHYLKMTFPETYRKLIEGGIKEDYTLGNATIPGFRAGICTPFYFFNLKTNKQSALKVYPFAIMDGTVRKYMNLNPKQAINEYRMIIDEVKKVNGTFISLWHNDSLSDKYEWKGWRRVFEEMVTSAAN